MGKLQVPEFNFKFSKNFEAYDYQQEAFNLCIDHMRESNSPAYIYASVSAGKSLMIAMLAKHFQNVNDAARNAGLQAKHQVLMLVRTGELVKQNSEEAWGIRSKNSIFCAGLNVKSTLYDCIMGSEKSVYNALHKELEAFRPTVVLIDEAHTLNFEDDSTQMMQTLIELRRRNKNLKIIGLTGSPWRGRESIKGDFWKKELARYDREYLTKRGFVMPVEYGFGDSEAHYSAIGSDGFAPVEEGDCDLTKAQLSAMEKKILSEGTQTQKIMLDVMRVMENRNCALITCSGRKHIEEAAKYLPEGSYATITEKTSTMDRLEIKRKCNEGELKYVLQIGCWSVGVSIPRIDTIVIMRLIGSMTVYEQLVGRGVRKLKQPDIDAGIKKTECLVMDYTDTSEIMAGLFANDELDQAENKRAKQNNEEMVICPACGNENSMRARRCSHIDDNGHRCEFFFSYKECSDMHNQQTGALIKQGCGTKNDPAAKTCRKCGGYMIDPNEKLIGQAYSKDDLIPLTSFNFGLTKAKDKVLATYKLKNGKTARELFDVRSREKWRRATWIKFVDNHCVTQITKKALLSCYAPETVIKYKSEVRAPIAITHRTNTKGFDIIARKEFTE
jgi:DNA repair protein RadD